MGGKLRENESNKIMCPIYPIARAGLCLWYGGGGGIYWLSISYMEMDTLSLTHSAAIFFQFSHRMCVCVCVDFQ